MSILSEVSADYLGWRSDKKPGVSPALFEEFEIDIQTQHAKFIRVFELFRKGYLKIYCTCPFHMAEEFGILYEKLTGCKIDTAERINYQEDKHSVSMKIQFWLESKKFNKEFGYLVNEANALPWDCKFFKENSKWVSAGSGATRFGFYLIRMGVRL